MGQLMTLLVVFVPLSLVTIGGGQTIVADIHRQVVEVNHWMTSPQFLDAFAISRMAPGPGSLLVTLIGWQVAGVAGAATATLAIFAPTSITTYLITRAMHRFRGTRLQAAIEAGLRPIAAGMILAAVYVLLQALEGGWVARAIAIASTAALLMSRRINPIILLGCGAAILASVHAAGLG